MSLRFETMPHLTGGKEVPILVDSSYLQDGHSGKVFVDDNEIDIDDQLIRDFAHVSGRMATERLPKDHFRDCVHFVMAMNGIWLPTSPVLSRSRSLEQVCNSSDQNLEPSGIVSSGTINGRYGLGSGNEQYHYSHVAIGTETSAGVRYIQKLGTDSYFGLSTIRQMLEYYDHQVVHPVKELTLKDGNSEVKWSRQEKTPTGGE